MSWLLSSHGMLSWACYEMELLDICAGWLAEIASGLIKVAPSVLAVLRLDYQQSARRRGRRNATDGQIRAGGGAQQRRCILAPLRQPGPCAER